LPVDVRGQLGPIEFCTAGPNDLAAKVAAGTR
jgi:hypothetical protein